MSGLRIKIGLILVAFGSFTLSMPTAHALFGEDVVVLLKLLESQTSELNRLSQLVGVGSDQIELIRSINRGIDETLYQIETVQTIVERAKGLEPRSVRSLAELNDLIESGQATYQLVDRLIELKAKLIDQAVVSAATQSDTSYAMGQEMIQMGSSYQSESAHSSPGRAAQITAASQSAQLMAKGVELQTQSQMIQMQAMQLDLAKTQASREVLSERARTGEFQRLVDRNSKRRRP